MAGERFVDLAVVKLAAYVRANLPAKLRAVETAQGLTTNSLIDPVEYVEANVPTDTRNPLVEVFDTLAQVEDAHADKWMVACTVALSFTGDADLVANERTMRRYATALKDCIRASRTLGGTVKRCDIGDYSSEVVRGPNAAIRYVFTINARVGIADT
jgi:hypothetical protein